MTARLKSQERSALANLPLFAELRPHEVEALLEGATIRTYAEDSLLFSAGDPADHFYAVLEGFVRLFALSKNGDETIVEVIGAGNSFAEAAIFASGRYPLNAEAMAGSRLVSLQATTLMRLLRQDAQVGLRILAAMSRWHVHLLAELQQLKGTSPAQRLAWYLLELVDKSGGETMVSLPYRKGVVARRIGMTPESLSRAMARLQQLGVDSSREQIHVRDPEALRRFCRG